MLSTLLLLAPLALAGVHDNVLRRHQHKARMPSGDIDLAKKQDGGQTFQGRATFFDVGLGACGQVNVPSDYIVALNTPQYGSGSPGPECFQMITITYNGLTAQAQIMDECPSCPYGALDMSTGLFTFFAPESVGVFQMTWWYNSDPPSPPTTSTPAQPSTTWQPPPTTSQWVPPTTTSTSTTPTSTSTSSTPTSTSTSISSTSISSSPAPSSTSSASNSSSTGLGTVSLNGTPTTLTDNAAAATATGAPGTSITVGNQDGLNQLVVALGNIIAKAPASG